MMSGRGMLSLLPLLFGKSQRSLQEIVDRKVQLLRTLTQASNPKRQYKKSTGLKGRQWVKHRKAMQRAGMPVA